MCTNFNHFFTVRTRNLWRIKEILRLSPHPYSVTALPSKTYTAANTDGTFSIFSNVQSFKFHSKQFCTCFIVAVLIHNSALWRHDYVVIFGHNVFCFTYMVLIVLLGLNGQNNEGRSLFVKGSTNGEKMGAKRLIKRVSEQEMVCGKYESFD